MTICGGSDWPFCPQAGLPNGFCCASNTTCIALAGNTTALCCPGGSNCERISPITCNLTLQDPTTDTGHPEIQTSELRGPLPACGTGCCPWGYSCIDDGDTCLMDWDQSKAPHSDDDDAGNDGDDGEESSGQTSSLTSSRGSSTTTSSTSPLALTTSSTIAATSSVSSQGGSLEVVPTGQSSQETGTSSAVISTPEIIGIAVGGFLGFALVSIICYLVIRLRQAKKVTKDDGTTGGSGGGAATQEVSSIVVYEPKPELENTQIARPVHEMA
ncbi:hypothetical protein F5X99DRAFT_372833 [Biscogniauxia marginata]|nr:hypothetical protein F5X99DRAFT_372833 [Biscogniauxia marginata]